MISMRAMKIFSVLLAAWGLMVLLPWASLAEEAPDYPLPEDKIPRLGDHRFTPNNLTSDPFIRTYVRNSLGMGKAVARERFPLLGVCVSEDGASLPQEGHRALLAHRLWHQHQHVDHGTEHTDGSKRFFRSS